MNQDSTLRARIAALGRTLGLDVLRESMALFRELHVRDVAPTAADCAYGPHARQRLDIYAPVGSSRKARPVFVWVHGGGFVRGEKRSPDHPFNAHVGAFAARCGWIGVVMNYRLAPDFGWPAGGEDVGAVVDWLKENAAAHGGEASKIFLAGSSAGAIHVATYLRLRGAAHGVRGAVLLSGLYGATPLEGADRMYYGNDESLYPERSPLKGPVESGAPLLVVCAEFDPPRFQTEWRLLLDALQAKHGALPRAHVASGHNHYTLAMHLGTADTRLSNEIVQFVRQHAGDSNEP